MLAVGRKSEHMLEHDLNACRIMSNGCVAQSNSDTPTPMPSGPSAPRGRTRSDDLSAASAHFKARRRTQHLSMGLLIHASVCCSVRSQCSCCRMPQFNTLPSTPLTNANLLSTPTKHPLGEQGSAIAGTSMMSEQKIEDGDSRLIATNHRPYPLFAYHRRHS